MHRQLSGNFGRGRSDPDARLQWLLEQLAREPAAEIVDLAETIPPADAYATRTPPNPKQGTTLATIEGYVTAAEQNGGGWVQLVFHHVCDGCDAYSISAANLSALLDWLQPRAAAGTVVETTDQVIGGTVQPVPTG